MEFFDLFYNALITNGVLVRNVALGLLGVMGVCFCIQLWYYLGVYGGLPRFRNNRGVRTEITPPPVSVIVVVRENNYYFVENGLQKLLDQAYHQFEVVVVDCSYDEEISEMLSDIRTRYEHMHLTQIKATHNHDHSIKLAITVGIKAARYEHLLLTTADSYPTSDKWIALMAKGFITGDVVLGYCGIERQRGLANRLMQCSRLATSVRWLSAAIRGHAYRGISHNLGYTKSLYFSHKGFNHLNMNIGDDDLFIRRIVSRNNVSVVMNPNATVRQIPYGGLGWWTRTRKYFSHAFRYYPSGVRLTIGAELWSRLLFFASAIAAMAVLPLLWLAIPVFFLLLRLLIVTTKMKRIARRLGERKLMWAYVLYDLYAPLTEAGMALSRRLRPNRAIWR